MCIINPDQHKNPSLLSVYSYICNELVGNLYENCNMLFCATFLDYKYPILRPLHTPLLTHTLSTINTAIFTLYHTNKVSAACTYFQLLLSLLICLRNDEVISSHQDTFLGWWGILKFYLPLPLFFYTHKLLQQLVIHCKSKGLSLCLAASNWCILTIWWGWRFFRVSFMRRWDCRAGWKESTSCVPESFSRWVW